MRPGISLSITSADLDRLRALVRDRNSPQKHAWRAQIVLLSAEGVGTNAIRPANPRPASGAGRSASPPKASTASARQDAALAHREARSFCRRARRRVDPGGAAARSDALDQRGNGRGGRRQREFGAAHLARSRAPAASCPAVQALQGPRVRRQVARHRRSLRRSAGARRRSFRRREEPDPGARPNPARPAAQERPRRNHDTHDYKRSGTTTLFAAMNVLGGTVIGQNMQRCRFRRSRPGVTG